MEREKGKGNKDGKDLPYLIFDRECFWIIVVGLIAWLAITFWSTLPMAL